MRPGQSFYRDNIFSRHKDLLLAPHWEKNSYQGKYVIPGSFEMQKNLGIDVILQNPTDPLSEITVDTKHNPRITGNFFLEELSCSVKGRETLGWILKETGHPDFITYCFWPQCDNCPVRYKHKNSCWACKEEVLKGIVYDIPFPELRSWFSANKNRYKLFKITWTSNMTTGRLVKITDLEEAIPVIKNTEYIFSIAEVNFEIHEGLTPQIIISSKETTITKSLNTLTNKIEELTNKINKPCKKRRSKTKPDNTIPLFYENIIPLERVAAK